MSKPDGDHPTTDIRHLASAIWYCCGVKRPRAVFLLPDDVDVVRLGPKPDRAMTWMLPELSRQGYPLLNAVLAGMPGDVWGPMPGCWVATPAPRSPGALAGLRVLVTRDEQGDAGLGAALRIHHAVAYSYAALRIEKAPDEALKREISRLSSFDWVAFTSGRAVGRFFEVLAADGDARRMPRTAVVGDATGAILRARGFRPDLVAKAFTAAELGRRLTGRILHPTSDPHSPDFAREARKRGATVVEPIVYRIRKPKKVGSPPAYDLVTFASSQTVRNFVDMTKPPKGTLAACIGPVTAKTARQLGFKVVAVPKRYTIPDLVKAIVAWRKKSR